MLYCGEHKMSKSLGNMVFLDDLLNVCPPDAIRLYLLGHHYREPWNHDKRDLAAARTLARKLSQALNGGGENASDEEIERRGGPFVAALADDLDTPRAIQELRKLAQSDEPQTRRVGRALGERVLGLTFEAHSSSASALPGNPLRRRPKPLPVVLALAQLEVVFHLPLAALRDRRPEVDHLF